MRKIIVGVDLSPGSEVAVAHAVDRARRDQAEVVLVLVDEFPEPPAGLAVQSAATQRRYRERVVGMLEADRRGVAEIIARWQGSGVRITQLVVDGHPDERLPAVAFEACANLLVVGSQGRTGVKRLLIGSVAERVARLAECSVLIARGAAPSGGYRHVVVGTDFTELARKALDHAVAAAAPDARIDVVNCWNGAFLVSPDDGVATGQPSGLYGDVIADVRREGEAWIAAARDRGDRELRFRVVERPATYGIADYARDVGADLIAVGSHGRRGVRRFLLGSVAETTARHAPCSTLIVR
jgi:nucleotide-binding universal stress UspA family protein